MSKDRVQHYVLTETYYARSQASSQARETTIKAEYQLSVTDRGKDANGKQVGEVVVTRVVVNVDVPAQKRKGEFDTFKSSEADTPFKHWELVRPAGLAGVKLSFVTVEGKIERIEGLRDALRKFTELFDRDFRGSEAADHVRSLEIAAFSEERMRDTWGRLLWADLWTKAESAAKQTSKTSGDSRPNSEQTEKRQSTVQIEACIPSESWKTTLQFPCSLTMETSSTNQTTICARTGTFSTDVMTKTTIGPCGWSYQVKSGSFEERCSIGNGGQIAQAGQKVEVELNSVLSLDGREIPVQLTLRHEFALRGGKL